jgi:formate hydrogenlyase subunit 6/NADH:ubiquinone oxidoreductase subunit I
MVVRGNGLKKEGTMPTKRRKIPVLPTLDAHTCTGCGSCMTICPTKCITTTAGPRLDFAPTICTIDLSGCVGCKLCEQICPWDCIEMIPAVAPALRKVG